jgi:hypothetical protein
MAVRLSSNDELGNFVVPQADLVVQFRRAAGKIADYFDGQS